ncbi:MAG: hypothetical protein J6P64_01005 [Bacteroidales bacterium]|nr:hypothetical protein [Bacteroidales bacterium]
MNIEQKIRNNAASFDDVKMPSGSRERFLKKLSEKEDFSTSLRYARNDDKVHKLRFMTWTSVAAAAVTIIMVITGMITDGQKAATQIPQTATADNKLVEMRQMYDARMDQAIIDLENVMQNVDDSTRMQINAVIDGLLNTGDVFAELAPLPEEKQMAIAEQIYDNKLRTLELLTDKLNK